MGSPNLYYRANSRVDQKQKEDEAESLADSQVTIPKRSELLEQFYMMYSWRLPMELTPIDQTLAIVARVRKYKSTEFIPISRVKSLADNNKDVHVVHIRIKGANGDLLLDPSKSLSRRNSDIAKISTLFFLP